MFIYLRARQLNIKLSRYSLIKRIGSQTYACTLYETFPVAEHFVANFIKIFKVISKLYDFKDFGSLIQNRGCEGMTSLPHKKSKQSVISKQILVNKLTKYFPQ